VVRDYPSPIDLLLSDVILPGLSGPELARHLCSIRPGMKVLLMSGYSDGYVDDENPQEVPFIPKPFSVGELGRMVRKVLDR
jgi:DNA-binding NtrC family response regulator